MINEPNANSAAQDLAYIRRIMEEARHEMAERGEGFIIWGFVVLLGLLGTWLIPMHYPGWALGIFWPALVIVGWIATWARLSRHNPGSMNSWAGKLCGAAWLACTIAMLLIFCAGIPAGVIPPEAIFGIVAAVVGIGVFLNGILVQLRWFRNLAFCWWAGAVAEFIWHGPLSILIMAILIIAFYLIPGFILNAQARKLSADKRA